MQYLFQLIRICTFIHLFGFSASRVILASIRSAWIPVITHAIVHFLSRRRLTCQTQFTILYCCLGFFQLGQTAWIPQQFECNVLATKLAVLFQASLTHCSDLFPQLIHSICIAGPDGWMYSSIKVSCFVLYTRVIYTSATTLWDLSPVTILHAVNALTHMLLITGLYIQFYWNISNLYVMFGVVLIFLSRKQFLIYRIVGHIHHQV